jgi:hypothetical protein
MVQPKSSSIKSSSRYVTVADLARCGLTPRDVARFCLRVVEYTSLDGEPCWLLDELVPLLPDQEDFAS